MMHAVSPLHRRALITVLVAMFVLALGALPASAHTRLESSTPEQGATVTAAPAEVMLTFNEPVDDTFNQVEVRGPGGTRVDDGAVETLDRQVRVALAPLAEAGTYEVAYRIVSGDSHPVEGRVTFEVSAAALATGAQAEPAPPSPGTGAATTTAAGSAGTRAAAGSPSAGASGAPAVWITASLLGVAGAGGLGAWALRRQVSANA